MPEDVPVCHTCGTCCVAPDISSLNKLPGVRCPHLNENHLCRIYEHRPGVCRGYQPDELCQLVAAPHLQHRVRIYLELFGLVSGEGE